MVRKEALTVAQKPSGLRFDIYERVHLPEGVAGIQELDEVELIPEIQVTPVGEQALLKGHLTLNSTYGSINEGNARSTELLQYQIPVEITLPMSRVKNIENISVEIENFDVDLLSARSLNVTGVLSLNGIETMSIPDEDLEGEDEVVFVHDASSSSDEGEEVDVASSSNEAAAEVREEASLATEQAAEETSSEQEENKLEQRPAEAESNAALEAAAPVNIINPASELDSDEEEAEINDEELVSLMDEVDDEVVDVSAKAEPAKEEPKKEPKIAFGSKQSQDAAKGGSFQWTSWFRNDSEAEAQAADGGANASAPTAKAASGPEAAAGVATASSAGEATGWKSFLLSNRNEQQFRKVRMCIVQKDDTLDSIAQRYSMKAKEIQLYNKLSGSEVTEGQVIYLPTAQ
jgi:stage VI sporulation protein D